MLIGWSIRAFPLACWLSLVVNRDLARVKYQSTWRRVSLQVKACRELVALITWVQSSSLQMKTTRLVRFVLDLTRPVLTSQRFTSLKALRVRVQTLTCFSLIWILRNCENALCKLVTLSSSSLTHLVLTSAQRSTATKRVTYDAY